ncbi:pyridoxamine 5'-phosphate oxidase family protein [Actinoplanes sp. LDG1-06]|uniref:Pyridoxamine 5'-phosphate oxidase family protein n=1 Tax=Paractinoplanes ovalisporus TaxID=2810368 RepID=A0ABS2A2Q2_9ACTN|nr:pyridoxamine 5'-phosphate oxidase family protein [Actinoplanes ovalisporus]MBM2614112.1 pyridoxamine 5'-phosphate oxidase family protein [Actinoplanes ovalisporus]
MDSLIDAYRTCELLTVSRDGTPIAWPTIGIRRPDGTFLISTSIGLPQKAFNVRRDGRVAVLFSDPTASGLDAPEQVLMQGTATCPDELVTTPGPWADLWLRIRRLQPSSTYHRVPGLRRFMDWYYMRLLITVTPARTALLPPYRPSRAPEPIGDTAFPAVQRMSGFGGAVLSAYDADGLPTMRRVHPAAVDGMFVFEAGEETAPGRASLLWHSHDDKVDSLKAFVVAGDLTRSGSTWKLTPSRYVSTADRMGPVTMVRTIRGLRRTAARYLTRRDLTRPAIAWDAFIRTERAAAERGDRVPR